MKTMSVTLVLGIQKGHGLKERKKIGKETEVEGDAQVEKRGRGPMKMLERRKIACSGLVMLMMSVRVVSLVLQ